VFGELIVGEVFAAGPYGRLEFGGMYLEFRYCGHGCLG